MTDEKKTLAAKPCVHIKFYISGDMNWGEPKKICGIMFECSVESEREREKKREKEIKI